MGPPEGLSVLTERVGEEVDPSDGPEVNPDGGRDWEEGCSSASPVGAPVGMLVGLSVEPAGGSDNEGGRSGFDLVGLKVRPIGGVGLSVETAAEGSVVGISVVMTVGIVVGDGLGGHGPHNPTSA